MFASGKANAWIDWDGKKSEVSKVILPFQAIETVNEPRTKTMDSFIPKIPLENSYNLLIWGDNRLVMNSLLPKLEGKVDLIYIDPPFATGADFSFPVKIESEKMTKEPTAVEIKAYRDTWGQGIASYLQMMYERLVLMRQLLSDTGSIYVHLDAHVGHYVKILLDEIFGVENFRSQIVWKRMTYKYTSIKNYGVEHDIILFYSKTADWKWNSVAKPYSEEQIATYYKYLELPDGSWIKLTKEQLSGEKELPEGRRFSLIPCLGPPEERPNLTYEFLGHTRRWKWTRDRMEGLRQKGMIIQTSADGLPQLKQYLDERSGMKVNDLWLDIANVHGGSREFTGFPTQKPEALLERIINASSNRGDLVADFFCGSGTTMVAAEKLGRQWVACDLSKFAVHIARKRLLEVPGCKPFQILNLGMYQKQKLMENGNGGKRYFEFVRELYGAAPIQGFAYIHGRRGNRLVHIGPIDSFVSEREIRATAREALNSGAKGIDVLGWDFEMGLHDLLDSIIKEYGIDIKLRQIPLEVLEIRADEKTKRLDEIRFFDLNYLDVAHDLDRRKVTVAIRKFNIANPEFIPEDIRSSIRNFTSYIDFWAVDFNFKGDTFHNMRQQYRTKENSELKTRISYEYEQPGMYSVLVKVVDIFGNDTNKLIPNLKVS